MDPLIFRLLLLILNVKLAQTLAINLLEPNQLDENAPNYCNDTSLMTEAGLIRSSLGQFLGYPCSAEFYHCRWQSDGFLTYKKMCKTGLVYDTLGTQNCNFDFNTKGCGLRSEGGADQCKQDEFSCPLSESCVSISQRCDQTYDCTLEEDEQNCPMCSAQEFPCIISEQCIAIDGRCDGIPQCADGTDEMNCAGCGHGFFFCQKSNQCVPNSQRCNNIAECLHGEDELLCKVVNERFYVCENRLDQVPINQVCDGNDNCPDGSDEKYCNQAAVAPHHSKGAIPINNQLMELMSQAAAAEVADSDRYSAYPSPAPEERAEDYDATEADEGELGEDEPLPAAPLFARFTPFLTTAMPPRTTARTTPVTMRPTTTTRRPRPMPSTVSLTIESVQSPKQSKFPFMPPGSVPRTSSTSVSLVSVTAAPVTSLMDKRGKTVASITITPAPPPVVSQSSTEEPIESPLYQVTRQAAAQVVDSVNDIDQELLQKLSSRFSSNGRFSPRDILSKLEQLLASSDSGQEKSDSNHILKTPSSTGSIPQYSPIRYPPVKTLVTNTPNPLLNSRFHSRVRVTGRPSARKWKPSLSNNPSHRTTPLPRPGETQIPIQFRQSDDSQSTSTTVPAPVVDTTTTIPAVEGLPSLKQPSKGAVTGRVQSVLKEGRPALRKHSGQHKQQRQLPESDVPETEETTVTDSPLAADEQYFTYDERP